MRFKTSGEFRRFFREKISLLYESGLVIIRGASSNTARLGPGYLFFALSGRRRHGVEFLGEALAKGAGSFLIEEPFPREALRRLILELGRRRVGIFSAPATSRLLSPVSNWVYDYPCRDIDVIAVTGTNGKTTTCYFLEAIARAAGHRVGVLGTVNYRIHGKLKPASLTTPQPDELFYYFDAMRRRGCRHAFIEATSQALDMGRLNEVALRGALFTNLTRDHLDYHKTMRRYFDAKRKLFFEFLAASKNAGRFAAVNIDDPWGRRLYGSLRRSGGAGIDLASFGFNARAQYRALGEEQDFIGIRFLLQAKRQRREIRLHLLGRHNVSNALAAVSAAQALGFSWKSIVSGLEGLRFVPGRLERVGTSHDRLVLVDYAHTPDALSHALKTLRLIPNVKRVVVVTGCGGDRDPGKRPLMGAIATREAHLAVFTSDNPRSEDPLAIIKQIETGALSAKKSNYKSIVDRAQAIAWALRYCRPGDAVLVAGKGHENYQIFKDRAIAFDDREFCRRALKKEINQL